MQPADREGRGICDGEGAGLRDVLGGGVPERDGVCRYEDADAAAGSCAGRVALQGVEYDTGEGEGLCWQRAGPPLSQWRVVSAAV